MNIIRVYLASLIAFLLSFAMPGSPDEDDPCSKKNMRKLCINITSGQMVANSYFCEKQIDYGGWTVFQRRFKRDTDFDRNWTEYKNGFGGFKHCKDFWLGNDFLHNITSSGDYELRIDMIYRGRPYFAEYSIFRVDNEKKEYMLTIDGFKGNVLDMFKHHNGMKFSTADNDNDLLFRRNCASHFKAGWWYTDCQRVNLNGKFERSDTSFAVIWESVTGHNSPLSSVEMKMRKTDYLHNMDSFYSVYDG